MTSLDQTHDPQPIRPGLTRPARRGRRLLVWPVLLAAAAVLIAACSAAPVETVVTQGRSTSSVKNLEADDGSYYSVQAACGYIGPTCTDWYGRFAGVPNSLSTLKISYKGNNTGGDGEQSILIFDWATSKWVVLDANRIVGTTDVAVSNLVPPGNLADYVSGASGPGDVLVRIGNFGGMSSTNANFLQINYG